MPNVTREVLKELIYAIHEIIRDERASAKRKIIELNQDNEALRNIVSDEISSEIAGEACEAATHEKLCGDTKNEPTTNTTG
jgi:hypothetical protein